MPGAGLSIALYEITPWERDYLATHLASQLPHVRLAFFEQPLTPTEPETVGAIPRSEADVLSVFIRSRVTADLLEGFPAVRLIATRSTGYDHIDLSACRSRDVIVSNVPRYGENTVAEHTFALILSLSRNVHRAYMRTSAGNFSLEDLQGFDLKGKTLGVVGAGSIGLHVIRIARAFDMRVLAFDTRPNTLLGEVLGFTYTSLDDLLRQSDIVTLHAPASPSTYHLINRERLQQMKRGALLINTARGSLVDTAALLWALDSGILGGAGLDVLEGEEFIVEESELLSSEARAASEEQLRTVVRTHMLLRRPDVVVTPHIAFDSREAIQRILDTTVANIVAFTRGEPQNVVGG